MRNAFSGPCLIVLALTFCHIDPSLALLGPRDLNDAIDSNCDAERLQSWPQHRHQGTENPKVPDVSERLSLAAMDDPGAGGTFYGDNDKNQKVPNEVVDPIADSKRSQHLLKTLRFQGLGKRTTQQDLDGGNTQHNRIKVILSRQRRQLNPIYLLDEKALEREARNVPRHVVNRQQKPRISAGIRYTGIGKKSREDRNSGYRQRYYGLGRR